MITFLVHICSINEDKQEPLSLLNSSRRFCIFSVAFSNDGKEILGGSNDGDLYIYDRELNQRTLKVFNLLHLQKLQISL